MFTDVNMRPENDVATTSGWQNRDAGVYLLADKAPGQPGTADDERQRSE